jgi:hypothetical protein
LIKVFINLVGPWPVGSLLALDTRELALSKTTPPESEDGFPLAVLLTLDERQLPTPGETVDLGEKNANGQLKRKIVDCFHPSQFGFQPVDCLLGPPSGTDGHRREFSGSAETP